MSRLGKLPIKLPTGVQVLIKEEEMIFSGPKGELKVNRNPLIEVKLGENELVIKPFDENAKNANAMWGLVWSLVKNAVIGVSEGFSKKLEINGVGFRVSLAGNTLNLSLGFSHQIEFKLPEGIKALVDGNKITIEGSDKSLVGETAAQIRRLRKPEPYKGKGVKYEDEIIRRKAGKTATKGK